MHMSIMFKGMGSVFCCAIVSKTNSNLCDRGFRRASFVTETGFVAVCMSVLFVPHACR